MNATSLATPRALTDRDLAYERLGEHFGEALSEYDTQRRVETLIDEFLADAPLQGSSVLEVGTGLGYFARRLTQRGANVTATDIAPSLVERVRQSVGCRAEVADALRLGDQFAAESFDVVLSSECIEHTPNPRAAVVQMSRLVRPGGYLVLSTPNVVWQPVVRLASRLRLRPFDGLENFSSWRGLRRVLRDQGLEVVQERGLHLFPFQFRMHGLSRWCDRRLQALRGGMINICLLGRKMS
jgi:2-polyprenyl-6-hydroxyphenyl methylase/3-demethylubiquinone-9 3-methyltransferase